MDKITNFSDDKNQNLITLKLVNLNDFELENLDLILKISIWFRKSRFDFENQNHEMGWQNEWVEEGIHYTNYSDFTERL